VVDIKQCTATTRNQAESCEGNSAVERRAQVQSYINQTELTSELNLQCSYFILVERRVYSMNNWLGENCQHELITFLACGNYTHRRVLA